VIFKILPLLAPIIIFILVKLAKSYISSFLFSEKKAKSSNEMIACYLCGTFVHESLIINKSGENYCSDKCSSI